MGLAGNWASLWISMGISTWYNCSWYMCDTRANLWNQRIKINEEKTSNIRDSNMRYQSIILDVYFNRLANDGWTNISLNNK